MFVFPQGKKRKGPSAKKLASLPNVPTFQRDELVAARQLIQAEASAGPGPVDVDTFAAAWDAVHGGAGLGTPEVVFLPSQGKFGPWASASRPDRLATITLQYVFACTTVMYPPPSFFVFLLRFFLHWAEWNSPVDCIVDG